MQQKVDKALRGLIEVSEAIKIRDSNHALWTELALHIEAAGVNLKYATETLEAIRKFNAEKESEKI